MIKIYFVFLLFSVTSFTYAEENPKIKEYIECVKSYMQGLTNTDVSNDQIKSIHENCKQIIKENFNDE